MSTWVCTKCGESVEDTFDVCWKCGTAWDGTVDPVQPATAADAPAAPASVESGGNPLSCVRCNQALQYVGRKRFHEGTNWGILGELGELFVKREHFDVYLCPRCGRVEFFVDGIGEQLRPD